MDELTAASRIVLANVFLMYFKAHSNHWNVEGKNFSQYHSFLGDLYEDLFDSVDTIAEEMRALDVYAPVSLMEMYNYKTVQEDSAKPATALDMIGNLAIMNQQVLDSLNKLFAACTAQNKQGFANFVADRIDKHNKHGWMLRSFLKSGE